MNIKKAGFTLTEVMIVIIIIGILVALAIPNYTAKIEQIKGQNAVSNIQMIASALKIYFLKNSTEPTYPIGSLSAINTQLAISLSDTDFRYNIISSTSCATIQARRNSGTYVNWRISYNINAATSSPDNFNAASFTNKWPWHP